MTSRLDDCREETLGFLRSQGIRFDEILFGMPMGERIVINDQKPSGLDMAVAFNLERDKFKLPIIVRER